MSDWDHYSRHDEQMLYERVSAMIQRGTVRGVDDARMMQIMDLQLKNGFKPSKIEHWHDYGFSMHPKAGAEVMTMALGGSQDHLIVIGTADRRYRLKVAEGEVALHDDQGQKVHFLRDKTLIELSKPVHAKSTQKVTIEAPTIELKGNISHTGSMTTTGVHTDANGVHV